MKVAVIGAGWAGCAAAVEAAPAISKASKSVRVFIGQAFRFGRMGAAARLPRQASVKPVESRSGV